MSRPGPDSDHGQQTIALERLPLYRTLDRLPLSVRQWLLLEPLLLLAAAFGYYYLLEPGQVTGVPLGVVIAFGSVPAWGLTFNLVNTVLILRVCEKPIRELMQVASGFSDADLRTTPKEILLYASALSRGRCLHPVGQRGFP